MAWTKRPRTVRRRTENTEYPLSSNSVRARHPRAMWRQAKVKFPGIRLMARDYDHCGCILARRGGRFGARGGGRGAMKTAKPQVGRPRGWVRAPIVSGGRIRAMMAVFSTPSLGATTKPGSFVRHLKPPDDRGAGGDATPCSLGPAARLSSMNM